MLVKGPQESISMILPDALIFWLKIYKSVCIKHLKYNNFQYQNFARGVNNCGWIPEALAFFIPSPNVSKILNDKRYHSKSLNLGMNIIALTFPY